ncbi:hypothetical protein AAGM63_28950, partial [Klebsiella pneumoniae]
KSAQIREILISESAWEEMTCLFAPSIVIFWTGLHRMFMANFWLLSCSHPYAIGDVVCPGS